MKKESDVNHVFIAFLDFLSLEKGEGTARSSRYISSLRFLNFRFFLHLSSTRIIKAAIGSFEISQYIRKLQL